MRSIEKTGKKTEDAINAGLKELGCDLADVTIDILDAGSPGLFGMFGRLAKVRLTVKEDDPELDFEMPTLSLNAQKTKPARKSEAPRKEEAPRTEKPAPKAEAPVKAEETAEPEAAEPAEAPAKAEKAAKSEKPVKAEAPAKAEKPAKEQKKFPAKKLPGLLKKVYRADKIEKTLYKKIYISSDLALVKSLFEENPGKAGTVRIPLDKMIAKSDFKRLKAIAERFLLRLAALMLLKTLNIVSDQLAFVFPAKLVQMKCRRCSVFNVQDHAVLAQSLQVKPEPRLTAAGKHYPVDVLPAFFLYPFFQPVAQREGRVIFCYRKFKIPVYLRVLCRRTGHFPIRLLFRDEYKRIWRQCLQRL